ncbi:MAG: DUF429 domain-containing protein [Gammaproteobacteria bacterium]|nr:DUF429 domain-containing protein [Gammaproteobacteria bacterium]
MENHKFYGIDFTSRPSAKKSLTCAIASFDGVTLTLDQLVRWSDFEAFEEALLRPGPWVMGIDFPFAQSRKFVENIGWPSEWSQYVALVGTMTRTEFRAVFETYKAARAWGDKQHKRVCDTRTRAQSPQTLHYTPVGLMFFEGAPRLLKSGVYLPYHHTAINDRVVVEAYPGALARSMIGRTRYKTDDRRAQTACLYDARVDILAQLAERSRAAFGFDTSAPLSLADDPSGDELDAWLCAIQAAWAANQSDGKFGAPIELDTVEGWIADPSLVNNKE